MSVSARRPRVLLLIDRRGWAFDAIAQALITHLSDRFAFTLLCANDQPAIMESAYDVIHVFYFGESRHRPFLTGRARVIKGVYSHRWEQAGMSPRELYFTHLREAHALVVPTPRLATTLGSLPIPAFHVPEGVDTNRFRPQAPRTGQIVAGWAGHPEDPIKCFKQVEEACRGLCELRVADGSLPPEAMPDFYAGIDIYLCASAAEGGPRTLLEAMASGRFPVSVRVGVAEELIRHTENGQLVDDSTDLRAAVRWCCEHAAIVRIAGAGNAAQMRASRDWTLLAERMADIYRSVL